MAVPRSEEVRFTDMCTARGCAHQRIGVTDGSSGDAVLDVQGRITVWNVAAERLLGLTESEALGQSLWTLRVPAMISPGIAPNVIGMPVGQGHDNFTRYASGRGANPISILAPVEEPETGSLAWAATRVKIAKVTGDGGLILFAGGMREHENEHR